MIFNFDKVAKVDAKDVKKVSESPLPKRTESEFRVIKNEAISLTEAYRKQEVSKSPFDNAARAIDRVVSELSKHHQLTSSEIAELFNHLNPLFLSTLAKPESARGRTDWTVSG
jgi:hypothetical protein